MSNWLQDAVKTPIGYAHPLTGEQLDCTSGLTGAVSYFQPNSGATSFVNPASPVPGILMFKRVGRRVDFVVQTLTPREEIDKIVWNYGDAGAVDTDGVLSSTHIFTAAGTFSVKATINYVDEEEDAVELTVSVVIT